MPGFGNPSAPLYPFHKFCKFYLQHPGKAQQYLQGRIPHAALDLGNIGAIDVRAERQFFLGNAKQPTLQPHAFPQCPTREKKMFIHMPQEWGVVDYQSTEYNLQSLPGKFSNALF